MLGFHLDMKACQYRKEFLAEFFPRLANAGYTHLFFELEDKVKLDTIRDSEWPEAYSKEEFAWILSMTRRAGLTPVPLIQTLGHVDYILSHKAYHYLRESPKSAFMLCPSKPEAMEFLCRYIDEVSELFGKPDLFHVGCDEAHMLGTCPACKDRVAKSSKGEIFAEHVNKVCRHVLARGSRPIAWADIPLYYTGSLDKFDRSIIWMDWDYSIEEVGNPVVAADFDPGFLDAERGQFVKGADGRVRPWYNTEYVMGKGFDIILAPSSRSREDHMFAPRIGHLGNVMSAALRAQRDPKPMGVTVTSWAMHLHHLDTQWPVLIVPQAAKEQAASNWREFKPLLTQKAFGKAAPEFFDAWERLTPVFLLAENNRNLEVDMHYFGQLDSIPYVLKYIQDEGTVEQERARMEKLISDYAEGGRILDGLAPGIPAGNRSFQFWRYGAKALRAKAEEYLLFLNALNGKPDRDKAAGMMLRLESLRDEYRGLISDICTPGSVERELAMIFHTHWRHLLRLSWGKTEWGHPLGYFNE